MPAPHTILRGVRKLPPATVLVVEPDGAAPQDALLGPAATRGGPRTPGLDAEDWRDAVLRRAAHRRRRRMVADVPVGVLLSGGLDSSLIVALLADAGQRGPGDVQRSASTPAASEGDEFAYSDLVAARVRDRPPPAADRAAAMVPARSTARSAP